MNLAKPVRVAISFGSNLGEREATVSQALQRIAQFVQGLVVSGLYESAPLYVTDQSVFLNGAAVGSTVHDPVTLLAKLKEVEHDLGRLERKRNGPREIDLDIVWMDGVATTPGAHPELPHPRAHERRFVLEPLAELDADIVLQGYGRVGDLLAEPNVQAQHVLRVSDAPVFL